MTARFRLLLSSILLCPIGQAVAAAPQNPPVTQQVMDALSRKLENTQWSFKHTGDYVQTGGVTVIKDGAWLGLRFRPEGSVTAWHDARIVHEGRWEVMDANTIRMNNCGPDRRVGLLLRFDAGFSSFTCPNDEKSSGKLIGKAPPLDLIVGRWHWNGGSGTVNFRGDGMAFMEWPNGERGKWRALGGDRYEVDWANGKFFDKIRMKSGNKELVCEGKGGRKFGARRVGTR